MKGCILFFTILSLAASAIAGPDERIAEIRKWYDTVQKAKPATERKISFEAESEPMKGEVTIRDFEGGWKKVTASYGAGDHAAIDEEFYFKDGKLFFTYVVTTHWMFHPDSTDEKPKTIDTRTENRYYYDEGKCIRCLTRSATSDEVTKLATIVAKLEQKQFDPHKGVPSDENADPGRAEKLLAAKTAADVLAAFEVK